MPAAQRDGRRGPRLGHFLATLLVATGLSVAHAQGIAQQIYAIVVDADGFPVRGLSAEDFSLRDGAVRQAVLGAEPATSPIWVAVTVHGFDREDAPAVRGAIERIAARVKNGPAGSRTLVKQGKGIASDWIDVGAGHTDTTDAYPVAAPDLPVLDVIDSACAALRRAPTDRRVVVLLLRARPEDAILRPTGLLTDVLFNSGAALWTVEITSSSRMPARPTEGTVDLDDLLTEATRFSGALRERVPNLEAIAPMAERVANLTLAQYVVTYQWPNPMLSVFSIATRHDRGEVLLPTWSR